ncbi:MAG: hypothetical protein U0441_02570 [Polyangiaceae bacterium]
MEFESQRYAFEIPTIPSTDAISTHDLVLFFHRVIQERSLGETSVDVADYSHVPGGPGVLLVCHEAHYSFARPFEDGGSGALVLRCATKRGAEGDTRARLRRVVHKTLRAAKIAEEHPAFAGRLRLDTTRAAFSIEDRLIAPNEPATFDGIASPLADVIGRVWGAAPVLAHAKAASKGCFRVEIATSIGPSVEELLSRI